MLVTGARNWSDRAYLERALQGYDPKYSILIHGNCSGADTLAGEVATALGWEVEVYPAQWQRYGRAAGPVRNLEMLHTRPHLILVCHQQLASSRGTKDCVRQACKLGYASRLIHPHPNG